MNLDSLISPIHEMSTYGGAFLNRLMCLVRESHGDLAARLPIRTRMERTVYLVWFHFHAQEMFGLGPEYLPSPCWRSLIETRGESGERQGDHPNDCLSVLEMALWQALPLPDDALDPFSSDDMFLVRLVVASWKKKIVGMPEISLSMERRTRALSRAGAAEDDLPIQLNSLMWAIWKVRKDLQDCFPLDSMESRARYALWFLTSGRVEHDLSQFEGEFLNEEYLNSRVTNTNENTSDLSKLSRLEHLFWIAEPELKVEYDLSIPDQLKNFSSWCRIRFSEMIQAASQSCRDAKKNSSFPDFSVKKLGDSNVREALKPGINVIGGESGSIGMGRHAQMTGLAAVSSGVQCLMIDGQGDIASLGDFPDELSGTFTRAFDFPVNVFASNANNFPSLLGRFGRRVFEEKLNVYYGNWEFERLPDSWVEIIAQFDCAWAPSRFSLRSLRDSGIETAEHVPLAVHIERFPVLDRKHFGLSRENFQFLFCFDFRSYIDRKNPKACVKAFKLAFPIGDEPAELVLKVKGIPQSSAFLSEDIAKWKEVLELAEADRRIRIIDQDMARDELAGLLNQCDAYISLHRSEGFGYTLAEAMLLGKPVIGTGYSGNVEFTLPEHSCPVDFELIPVEDELVSKIGHKGRWAEPDIEHTVWYMRNLVESEDLCRSLGVRAKEYILDHYSPTAVGAIIQDKLAAIMNTI